MPQTSLTARVPFGAEVLMFSQPQSNGLGKMHVHQVDMNGWVRFFTEEVDPVPESLPMSLSLALTEWFRQRPQLCMRCVAGVSRGGNTVELQAWYDVQVLPDSVQQRAEES